MAIKLEQTTRGYGLTSAQKVSVTSTSAQTTNVVGTSEVVLVATQDMWVTTGTNPTAVADAAGNLYLTAGEKFHMQIAPSHKVAAIRASTDGSLHVIPVA